MYIESVMPSNHLTLCRPLLLPSIFHSIRVFSNESSLPIMWPKYWSFNFSISLSSEYSGLISFRIDWFDLFAIQGTLKSLLQHHSLKTSILHTLPSFYGLILTSIQDYWENITLTRQTVFSKVMSLLFKMLSRFAIAFLPRSKCLLISWLHSPSTYHESKSESCLVVSNSLRSINYKVHGIFQTEILEWVAIPFSRGSSQHRD